jgi:hypothetical protein
MAPLPPEVFLRLMLTLKVWKSIPRHRDRQRTTTIAVEGTIFAFSFSKKSDISLLSIEDRVLDLCRAFDQLAIVDAHLWISFICGWDGGWVVGNLPPVPPNLPLPAFPLQPTITVFSEPVEFSTKVNIHGQINRRRPTRRSSVYILAKKFVHRIRRCGRWEFNSSYALPTKSTLQVLTNYLFYAENMEVKVPYVSKSSLLEHFFNIRTAVDSPTAKIRKSMNVRVTLFAFYRFLSAWWLRMYSILFRGGVLFAWHKHQHFRV